MGRQAVAVAVGLASFATVSLLLQRQKLTIATYDTPDKTGANMVCDGMRDEEEIMSALEALRPPAELELLPGHYDLRPTYVYPPVEAALGAHTFIHLTKDNLTIRGHPGTVLYVSEPLREWQGESVEMMWLIAGGEASGGQATRRLNGIQLSNLTLDMRASHFEGARSEPIWLLSNNMRVVKCVVIKGMGGMLVNGCNGVVAGNLLVDCAIGIDCDGLFNSVVSGNDVFACGRGIVLLRGDGNRIEENRVHHCYAALGDLFAAVMLHLGPSTNNTVRGNYIYENMGHGLMSFYSAGPSHILGNYFWANGLAAPERYDHMYIRNDGNEILRNFCFPPASAKYAVWLEGDKNIVKNNLLTGSYSAAPVYDIGLGNIVEHNTP